MIVVGRSIYIRSVKKYREYTAFFELWNQQVVPSIRMETSSAFSKAEVSESFKEIIFDQLNDFLRKQLLFEDYYEERLGQITSKGFIFDHVRLEGIYIWDKESLKEFLERYPDYILLDDMNKKVSFEEIFEKK